VRSQVPPKSLSPKEEAMIVLFVLLISLLIFRGVGVLGVEALDNWPGATRYALATMLAFTASAHFTKMRSDLVRMVPNWVPWPSAVVYFTGVCELAGAVGLLISGLRQVAGIALIVFFILVFPANVNAVQTGVVVGGRQATPLWLRAPMQLLFIALTWWSAL
jgi:uncharacterized membrane protein